MSQLPLPLKLADHAVFASFLPDGNEVLVDALRALADGNARDGAWVWGAASTGKSHLLQAVCEQCGRAAMYVAAGEVLSYGPGVLEGLEQFAVLCIDDIDRVAGDEAWERALFNLYNAIDERRGRLVVASTVPPLDAAFVLADLVSRLKRLPVFRMRPLDDAARAKALRLRARHRGLDLPTDTVQYLLRRSARDMHSLYELLDTLDTEALSQQRRLTVPFVRSVIDARDT